MSDGTADAIGGLFGLALGVGFTVATLNMLKNLSPEHRSEVSKLLSIAKRSGNKYVVLVRPQNEVRAVGLLNMAGFRILDKDYDKENIKIVFQEKKR